MKYVITFFVCLTSIFVTMSTVYIAEAIGIKGKKRALIGITFGVLAGTIINLLMTICFGS